MRSASSHRNPPAPAAWMFVRFRGALSIKILNPGVRSLIQDGGRFGLARYGVARSSAFDRMSWRLANELVGNNVPDEYATDAGPASIEVLLGGLRIEATRDLVVAVTGADVPVTCLDVDADDKRRQR